MLYAVVEKNDQYVSKLLCRQCLTHTSPFQTKKKKEKKKKTLSTGEVRNTPEVKMLGVFATRFPPDLTADRLYLCIRQAGLTGDMPKHEKHGTQIGEHDDNNHKYHRSELI